MSLKYFKHGLEMGVPISDMKTPLLVQNSSPEGRDLAIG